MTDCDRCGLDIYTECHCQIDEMSKKIDKLEERVGKLEKEIKCYDHNKAMQEYKKQMEKAQDNLINCLINGCKNFEPRCKDCGEVVNTSVLCLNDENKQSSPQIPTETPE